jgi:hypothetical protein
MILICGAVSFNPACASNGEDYGESFDGRGLNIKNKNDVYQACDDIVKELDWAHESFLNAQKLLQGLSVKKEEAGAALCAVECHIGGLYFLSWGGIAFAGLLPRLSFLKKCAAKFIADQSEQNNMCSKIESLENDYCVLYKEIEILERQAEKIAKEFNVCFEGKPHCCD